MPPNQAMLLCSKHPFDLRHRIFDNSRLPMVIGTAYHLPLPQISSAKAQSNLSQPKMSTTKVLSMLGTREQLRSWMYLYASAKVLNKLVPIMQTSLWMTLLRLCYRSRPVVRETPRPCINCNLLHLSETQLWHSNLMHCTVHRPSAAAPVCETEQ